MHALSQSMGRTAPCGASMMALVEHCYASAHRALEEGDEVGAQRLFGVLAAMAPRDERGWIGLAVIRERSENWRAAAGLYGVGGAFAPTSAWCQFGKGRAMMRLGRAAEAEAAFRVAESMTDDTALLGALEKERSAS